jgi:hypothetical protein
MTYKRCIKPDCDICDYNVLMYEIKQEQLKNKNKKVKKSKKEK